MDNRMDQYQENNIEVLLKQLGLLRITKENTLEEIIEYMNEISVVPASATVQNKQAEMPKSMVLDPG